MGNIAFEIEYLWKDRKRVLGMPITFTGYMMSEDRVFLETGLLHLKQEELLLYRVRDLSLSISLGQRMFGVGTVTLQSSDKTTPMLVLKNIKRPREVKEILHRQVELMKQTRRIRVGEVMGDHDLDVEEEPQEDTAQ